MARKLSADDIREMLGTVGRIMARAINVKQKYLMRKSSRLFNKNFRRSIHQNAASGKRVLEGPMSRAWRDGKWPCCAKVFQYWPARRKTFQRRRLHQRNEWKTIDRAARKLDKWAPDIESQLHSKRFDEPGSDVFVRAGCSCARTKKRAGAEGVEFLKAHFRAPQS
mgnify:CR=1 FL=1